MVFKAGDPNKILLGGAAHGGSGRFYVVPVIRGANNHIVSFGTPTVLGFGVNNDGGIAYGLGGVLFYSEYPVNNVGEVKPGSSADDKTVALTPLGIASSTGALDFVPPGYNGAGQFKISNFQLVGRAGRLFVARLTGAEGAAIDPLTGDFLFSTFFGGGNQIIVVRGFSAPVDTSIPTLSTWGILLMLLALMCSGLVFVRKAQGRQR